MRYCGFLSLPCAVLRYSRATTCGIAVLVPPLRPPPSRDEGKNGCVKTRKRFPGGTSYEAWYEAIVQMIGRSRVCKNFAQLRFEDFHYCSSIPSFRAKLSLKAVIPTVLTSLYQSFVFESFQCSGF